jgi:hypothetical protein
MASNDTGETRAGGMDSAAALRETVAKELAKQAGRTPELNKAFFATWSAIGNVEKNAKNPHLKNTYANLEAVMAVVKPAMVKNGLALIQTPGEIVDRNMALRTTILHAESGQVWNFLMQIPLGEKPSAQAYGSGNSYARRYFLMTLFSMCPVDDDGEAASEEAEEEDEEDPQELIKQMKGFKGKGKEGAAAFEKEFRVRAQASKATAEVFVQRRGEIKGAK